MKKQLKQFRNNPWLLTSALLMSGLYLTGCSSDNDDAPPADAMYEVTVINATNNQPLSPVAVITHSNSFTAWTVGSAASTELEYIAEGGSNRQLIDSLVNEDASTASGTAAIGPGGSETISITASESTQTLLTVATMLVNTNDAFSGITSIDISGLAKGDTMTMHARVYDAGTEINDEMAGSIPGPVSGGTGEGFNAARSDITDTVRSHGGVVSADDGLSASGLDQSHRFDNPGMIVTITRI